MTFMPTLQYADIFYGLRDEHLERIDLICREVVLDRGATILSENARGDEMYIVARGAVDIVLDPAILGLDH